MGKTKKFKVTENDYIRAVKKADRELEIERYGKQISTKGSIKHKSLKQYDRNKVKRIIIEFE